jgi:predicted secreted protein
MATTGIINGTLLRVLRNTTGTTYVNIGDSQTAQLSASHSPRPATSQDSAGWEESLEGLRSYSISVSGFHADDHTEGANEWLDELISNTVRGAVTWQMTTNDSGDSVLSGSGYIEGIEVSNGGPEESATYSFTIKGSGALVRGVVS